MSAAKVERLLNLSAALLAAERPLSAREIRRRVPGYPEELASFRRAFERDKDDLRAMGIPLRTEQALADGVPVDGYRIPPEDYALRDPGLDADELAALHLATNAVLLEGVSGIEALTKLAGSKNSAAHTPGAGAAPLATVPRDAHLSMLFTGLVDRHPVQFTYNDTARVVEPHRLDYQRGRWYLSGHDRQRGEARSYRVERIVGDVVTLTAEFFAPPENPHPGVVLQSWQLGADEPVHAEVLVDAPYAAAAARHLGESNVVERNTNGSVRFEVTVNNADAFTGFVLSFLDHAEVLGPPELRRRIVDHLTALASP